MCFPCIHQPWSVKFTLKINKEEIEHRQSPQSHCQHIWKFTIPLIIALIKVNVNFMNSTLILRLDVERPLKTALSVNISEVVTISVIGINFTRWNVYKNQLVSVVVHYKLGEKMEFKFLVFYLLFIVKDFIQQVNKGVFSWLKIWR